MPDRKTRDYLLGLGRAFGGAIIFSFPLLMTMEMWWLGFYMDRYRLALFLVLAIPMLVGLSYFSGFEKTFEWREDAMDAFAALGVGFIASAAMLGLFGLLEADMPANEIVGKVALEAVPASIGAMLGRKQMGDEDEDDREKAEAGYAGELFLMMVGAVFLAFNVAPTEEMPLIAYRMNPLQVVALVLVSLTILHAFVYTVGFAGQQKPSEGATFWSTFLHFTVAGYGIALLVSLYVLWTFGRTDGMSPAVIVQTVAVLGFPASLGAATARLIV